jgi:hypothetical protein
LRSHSEHKYSNLSLVSGKSVLASVVIDEVREQKLGSMAFFYCKHRDPNKCSFTSIIRGILSQLITQQRHLVPFYHDEGIASGEVPLESTRLCKKLLKSMLQNIPKCFLIIDGVDECAVEERRPLLEFLNEIVNICDSTDPGKVRILILSRDEPDIKNMLVVGRVLRLTPKDTLRDVEHFVHHYAIRVQEKFKLNDEDRAYIEQNVLDRTEGTISFRFNFPQFL